MRNITKWTSEQLNWLKINYSKASNKNTTIQFNKEFKTTRTIRSIARKAETHGIRRGPYGRRPGTEIASEKKQKFDLIKKTKGCYFCNEHDPLLLDFHHIDPKTKLFKCSDYSRKLKSLLTEIKKCEIVCCKCHRLIHANRLSIYKNH